MNENLQPVDGGFDVFREPWITCVSAGGDVSDYGIEGLFERAHELSEIVDPSPLVVVGVLRLLQAVLLSALEIDDEDRWLELWEAGRFDGDSMERVRECCSGRMDLFDAERPFYQSGDIGGATPSEESKSVGYLFAEFATGVNVAHYSHILERDHAFCEVCCAKGVVTLSAFATAGGPGIRPSIAGEGPLYVIPVGDSLFRTLLLNNPLADFRSPTASDADAGPCWLAGNPVPYRQEKSSAGFVESLTWQPRRLRLLSPISAGHCTRCGRHSSRLTTRIVYRQGWFRSKEAASWVDPWVAYIWDENGGSHAVRVREERATWRDAEALFLSATPQVTPDRRGTPTRPRVVNQIHHLVRELGVGRDEVVFQAVGLRASKDKVFEWRNDRFELPEVVLHDSTAVVLTRALRQAETAAKCLAEALLHLHPAMSRSNPKKGDIRKAMADVVLAGQRKFWSDLEPVFRVRLFDERLAGNEQGQADWLSEWTQIDRRTVVEALEVTLTTSDDTADGLRRQEAARHALYSQLKKGGVE